MKFKMRAINLRLWNALANQYKTGNVFLTNFRN